ncbi:hypothetical protein [Thauera aromatica]|uniref:TolA protein n=1 Tax=Thauera aromatica K172 TaxID=44139 RepID=A0A2R4BJ86_THAAR|nr:hypothetical protein [Thauera aromatica]AVR87378.1 TolA protein [Thauera aromatica K172]
MARKKTYEELTAALGEARAALADALLDGASTEEPRRRIADIEGEIAALEAEAEAKADADRAEEAARVEAVAVEIAAEQQAAVVAAVEVPGLEEVVGEPLPQPEPDSAVESASRYVARCRAALAQAEAEHKPLADEVEALRARMSAKIAACDAIRTRRSAGDERASDAAELALMTADAESLRTMADQALQRASAADHRAAAREALQAAEAQLASARSRAAFAVALTRLRMAENAYLNAFRTVVHTGRACGESSPWLRYKPSADLVRAATGQILPTASNPLFK